MNKIIEKFKYVDHGEESFEVEILMEIKNILDIPIFPIHSDKTFPDPNINYPKKINDKIYWVRYKKVEDHK